MSLLGRLVLVCITLYACWAYPIAISGFLFWVALLRQPCRGMADREHATTLATRKGCCFPPALSCRRPLCYGDSGAAARSVSSRSPIASHAVSTTPGKDRLVNSQSTHRAPTTEQSCPGWRVSKKRAGQVWA